MAEHPVEHLQESKHTRSLDELAIALSADWKSTRLRKAANNKNQKRKLKERVELKKLYESVDYDSWISTNDPYLVWLW